MTQTLPEPWLRGPLPGIPPLLQPAAHALIMAREDAERAVAGLPATAIWMSPSGITPLGFHLAHLSGSTDRLLTYARGASLDAAQKAALLREASLATEQPALEGLLTTWQRTVERALTQLAATPESTLIDVRTVGRAQLPSTVGGLIFHAAEHASRHTGQIVTTAALVRALTAAGANDGAIGA